MHAPSQTRGAVCPFSECSRKVCTIVCILNSCSNNTIIIIVILLFRGLSS